MSSRRGDLSSAVAPPRCTSIQAALRPHCFDHYRHIDCTLGFHVHTAEKSFTAVAASAKEQAEWVLELTAAIADCQNGLGVDGDR